MLSFELLDKKVTDVLIGMNIFSPTDPQVDVIPKILDGNNVLLVAPTGIGKTEAVMLPIFDMMLRTPRKGIRCIYVTPLRALNRDMLRRMEEFGKALDLKVGVRHGDTSDHERMKQSRDPPDILITTPETLQVLFTGKRLREHLTGVRWLVVDEIHELASVERGAQLSVAMERLATIAGEYQRIGSSATVGNVDDVARFLAGTGRDVLVSKHDTKRDLVLDIECPGSDDDPVLADRLQCDPNMLAVMERAKDHIINGRSTLFFVNTRETAEWLAARYHLLDPDLPIDVHHGSLSKENRVEMEELFKKGDLKALICTSSLELGIDVGSTDLVIQYNSPRQVSRMVQRAGRAGHRIGETIRAKIIATSPDELLEAAVIGRRTASKELEDKAGRPKPFTVLANQLIAMTMSSRMNRDDAFAVLRRSHAFRDLEKEEMGAVLDQLISIKLIFEDANGFRRSKKGMDYFYNNISMIPDERTYVIRDISTRGIVGTLDESFVATFAEPYAMFIAKGRTWRIVEMREDELLVEGSKEIGSVPSWTGSDIPVPYEVAMEVGRLRRVMNLDEYDCDDTAKERICSYVAKQKEKGFDVPSDMLVTLEIGDRTAIINSCFGTRVNETLSKIYSALLSARLGESVGISTDPYRIMMELPRNVGKDVLLNALTSIRPGSIGSLTKLTMANSSYLKWRFMYVAKKFGIIDKDADHRFINFSRLFDTYKDTAAYDDAVSKVLWEDLDAENTEKAIAAISDGTIKVKVTSVTPIGMEGVNGTKELMQPLRADHSILMAMKRRLEDEVVYASCLKCQTQRRLRVSDAPGRFSCGKCGGNMIAVLKEYEKDNIRLFGKKDQDDAEKKEMLRISRNANLVNENGKKAVMILVGRGIGPDSASRILNRMHTDEDDLLRDILASEVLYAKNKRFWD
ncbi:MAG: DEAD/DEAH box helicase [Methanomassiliicoccaceae archaeon]|nr:DEAD/DEAH box helicase [Methanomassiliicoccaceae archaeon]